MVHIGIIPDGNRRYAKKQEISTELAYKKGFNALCDLLEKTWLNSETNKYINKITQLTIYVCSYDNITKRVGQDKQNILEMIRQFITYFEEKETQLLSEEVCVCIAGNYTQEGLLPYDIVEKLNYIVDVTKNFRQYRLNLAICYDAKREVLRMAQRDIECVSDIYTNLFVQDDIDIVLRTGYERRTSGFFPIQTLYSEWFFVDKYWPEINFEYIQEIFKEYEKRERRLGS